MGIITKIEEAKLDFYSMLAGGYKPTHIYLGASELTELQTYLKATIPGFKVFDNGCHWVNPYRNPAIFDMKIHRVTTPSHLRCS